MYNYLNITEMSKLTDKAVKMLKGGQMFPFERNRYYAGKMLTSADFQAEQLYMNHKRQFLNQRMFGSGVVCGLSAANLDGLSIIVEAGAAIDGFGKEIVVPSDVVRKLSSLEGFGALKTENVLLCLRYKEEPVHMMYAAGEGSENGVYEYNRISEGFELFLTDEGGAGPGGKKAPEFITYREFLKNQDFLVTVAMPQIVCRGKFVRVEVTARKLSGRDKALSFDGILQTPAFSTEEGGRELVFRMQGVRLEKGASCTKDYWIRAEEEGPAETEVILKKEGSHAYVGEYEAEPKTGLKFNVKLTDKTPRELAVFWSCREKREDGEALEGGAVCLARLKLLRTESAYMIDSLTEDGVREYIMAPAEEGCRNLYLSYFKAASQEGGARPSREEKGREAGEPEARTYEEGRQPLMASGSMEIPLRMDMKKGDVCYSEEIMHGLGKGNVYVDVGVECLENDGRMGKDVRSTIYGASELFDERGHMRVQTAVRVFNDKGSFQVAAKLLGEQRSIVLLVNWVAIKFVSEEESRLGEDYSNAQIAAVTPTVRLHPKESHYFEVKFRNLKPCVLGYELTEPGGGEISADGVYTAPAKEGVYEIRISCMDMPEIATYAYAVVRK